jgi:branched-chain amino acid transport system substrate-binding protein
MSKKFDAEFRALSGVEPEYHSAGGYACGQVLQQAVEATGSLDNHKLREAVLNMTFDTVMGQLRFGDDGLPVASFPVAQWQNGVPELVYPDAAKTKSAQLK